VSVWKSEHISHNTNSSSNFANRNVSRPVKWQNISVSVRYQYNGFCNAKNYENKRSLNTFCRKYNLSLFYLINENIFNRVANLKDPILGHGHLASAEVCKCPDVDISFSCLSPGSPLTTLQTEAFVPVVKDALNHQSVTFLREIM
jgi:hypothetical protein